jgi:hypothetical protein
VKPGIDNHFQINKRYYSVPHQLVGVRLDARITAKATETFHKENRIATHIRSRQQQSSTHNQVLDTQF